MSWFLTIHDKLTVWWQQDRVDKTSSDENLGFLSNPLTSNFSLVGAGNGILKIVYRRTVIWENTNAGRSA